MNRRQFMGRSAAGLAALASAPAEAGSPDRPSFSLTTDDAFDPASVDAYRGAHPQIYAHVDENREPHLERLRVWLRQPSVSAENLGIAEMAELLRSDLEELGFAEAELVPTAGHPGVWGWFDAGAPRTLLVYMMYDVQPVERSAWRVDPFAAELVDHALGRAVMARGAINQKGPQRAFLNALSSVLAVTGTLPVNIMLAAEGEEELGSPHYGEVVDRYEDRLRTASGVLFPSPRQASTGTARLTLGVKGIVYFELESAGGARGGPTKAGIHSSYKVLVDSPVWHLVHALASLTTPDGNRIRVPGYYDAIRAPSLEEERLINGMRSTWNDIATQQTLGVERWLDGVERDAAILRYLTDTTLNIDGVWGGYAGPGTKTVLPHKAAAKLDSRLVPDQKPDEALRLIRSHLDRQGFADVALRKLTGYPPAQTSVEAPIVQAMISVYRKYGAPISVWPRSGGSAPYYQFTERMGLPMISGGLGHGGGFHAPDEFLVVDPKPGSPVAGLADMEKFYVDLLYACAS